VGETSGDVELADICDDRGPMVTDIRKAETEKEIEESRQHEHLFENFLLLTGVHMPKHRLSPWWICWIWCRVMLLASVAGVLRLIFAFYTTRTLKVWFQFPVGCANLSAGLLLWYLPGIARDLLSGKRRSELELLDQNDVSAAKLLSTAFFVFWMTAGLAAGISRGITTGIFMLFLYDTLVACGSTPVLSSALFLLAIETTLAVKEVRLVQRAAQDKSLTRGRYNDISVRIKQRQRRWGVPLKVVAGVAFYNLLGFIFTYLYILRVKNDIFHHKGDPNSTANRVEVDTIVAVMLFKGVFLFFAFMLLVMRVNDKADSVVSVLMEKRWGEHGSASEAERLELLFLSTTYAITPEALNSWWSYFTEPQLEPISFYLSGVRVTRRLALGIGLSVILAMSKNVLSPSI